MPDFIGIGIIHSASGWLWEELKQHPDMQLPKRKEINFFLTKKPLHKYAEWFKGIPKHKVTGELSVKYINSELALQRIQKIPKTKLFCIVRNPVDVAFSYYKGSRFRGVIPKENFLQAILKGYPNVNIKKFMISDKLSKWTNAFKIKFFLYDDLIANPIQYISDVYEYLGVNPKYKSPTVLEWKKRPYAAKFGNKEISNRARRKLAPLYSEEIIKMEKITGLDLNSWRKQKN